MTTRAIEPEASIRNGKWRVVVVHALRCPTLIPIPTILCALRILDHDGPAPEQGWPLQLIARCRSGVLLFYNHGAVGNDIVGIFPEQPVDDCGRIVNLYRRVDAVAGVIYVRPGIAQSLVFTPLQFAIYPLAKKRLEFRLESREPVRQKGTWQRQSTLTTTSAWRSLRGYSFNPYRLACVNY